MIFNYLAQDEYDVVEEHSVEDGKKLKDPIEIKITITIERSRYESVNRRRIKSIPERILDLFKATK